MSGTDEHATAPHGDELGEAASWPTSTPGADDDGARDAGERGLTGILDALADAVSRARAMPMSSSVLVSRAELLDLVAQAKAVLPTQLVEADEVLATADAQRAEADAQAEQLLAEARREATELVSRESVTREAHVEAERIRAEALEDAERMRREADDYCDRRLGDFEIDLGRVLAQVQAGRAKLAERLDG